MEDHSPAESPEADIGAVKDLNNRWELLASTSPMLKATDPLHKLGAYRLGQ